MANVFKNLVMMFPSACMNALSQDMCSKFVENLRRLTCAFGVDAAMEEEVRQNIDFSLLSLDKETSLA